MSVLPPHRPWYIQSVNSCGRALTNLGIKLPSLSEESLLARARKMTGLTDFGDDEFRLGLQQLLQSLDEEAELNQVGRIMAATSLTGYLKNRLLLEAYTKQHPDVADQEISQPIFIVGLPRTGTTILFNLLAQDSATRVPLAWEVGEPFPPPTGETYHSDTRIKASIRQYAVLDKLAPSLKRIHEFAALLPQECVPLLRHEFLGLDFQIMYRVPSYHQWLQQQDMLPALRMHKRFLQLLQHRYRKDRWVLKSPVHLHNIEELLQVYPDARIVQTHRDPAKVLPSLASLSYTLRGMSSDRVDAKEAGHAQMAMWRAALMRAIRARERLEGRSGQFFDVQYHEMTKDPIATIETIYRYFDIPFTLETKLGMEEYLANNSQGKYGRHHYSAEDFGIEPVNGFKVFSDYCDRFNIPPETV